MPNFSGTWTARQQMQAKGASIWPTTPGAPTIGTATAGTNKCASVTFTAPACTGLFPSGITGYKVTSTPGCFTATGASSPLTVTGLTAGTSYTFKAQATNGNGYGALSAASNSVTATIVTCATYTTAGSYSWVAPSGVTSVAVVAIGGGGSGCYNGVYAGGPGGGLGYKNSYSVTPGSSYTVVVGAGGTCGSAVGGNSYFVSTATVKGGGGAQTGTGLGGTYTGDGGGTGGNGGRYAGGLTSGPGGGGAGGYSGNGGNGGATLIGRPGCAGAACSGAGGGGGAGYRGPCGCGRAGGCGGGVGIYGKGTTGAGGAGGYPVCNTTGGNGGAGSGGCGVSYGGGGGYLKSGRNYRGAVRVVWCKCGVRGTPSFPSTNVGA